VPPRLANEVRGHRVAGPHGRTHVIAEFREFINRGSFIDLAVGFVMGVAVTGVVNALVDRVVMPTIGLLFGEPNFDQILTFGGVDADGVAVGSIGAVITALVNFLFIALALFFIVKGYNAMQRKAAEGDGEAPPEPDPADVVLLREILEELRQERGATGGPAASSSEPT